MTAQDRIDTIATIRYDLQLMLGKLRDLGVDTRGVYIRDLDNELQEAIWEIQQDAQ